MKSIFKTLMVFMLFVTCAFSQEAPPVLTDADWEKIIPHLEAEQWNEAEKVSGVLLKKFTKDQEESVEAGMIRYIYLCSVGGMLGEKQINKDEALKKVKDLKGKNIITAGSVFKSRGIFNFFSYSEEEKKWNKCFANNNNTVIYLFEYFDMGDINALTTGFMDTMEGKVLRLGGIIKDISAEGYAMPRLRVDYSGVEILDVTEQE